MPVYEFEIVLADPVEANEQLADRLFEAGCDDGTLASCDGRTTVGFAREADSLEEAVRSAVRDVLAAEQRVASVEPVDRAVFTRINAELTGRE